VTDQQLAEALADLSPDEIAELESKLARIPPGEALGLSAVPTRLVTRSRTRACFDFTRVSNAERQIADLPLEGESIHCLMAGDYNGSDLIPAIQSLAGETIQELQIATLGFNQTNISQLCAMFDDGLIRCLAVACSDYFRDTSRQTFDFAVHELTNRGQRITSTRTHAKVILFRFRRGRYVVESSANLRSCNNVEQFALTRSAPLYRFHHAWLEHIHGLAK
jgi:hypothetical protein